MYLTHVHCGAHVPLWHRSSVLRLYQPQEVDSVCRELRPPNPIQPSMPPPTAAVLLREPYCYGSRVEVCHTSLQDFAGRNKTESERNEETVESNWGGGDGKRQGTHEQENRERERETGRHQNREREECKTKEESIKVKYPEEARLEEYKKEAEREMMMRKSLSSMGRLWCCWSSKIWMNEKGAQRGESGWGKKAEAWLDKKKLLHSPKKTKEEEWVMKIGGGSHVGGWKQEKMMDEDCPQPH